MESKRRKSSKELYSRFAKRARNPNRPGTLSSLKAERKEDLEERKKKGRGAAAEVGRS